VLARQLGEDMQRSGLLYMPLRKMANQPRS
jgi:hypothetical protein